MTATRISAAARSRRMLAVAIVALALAGCAAPASSDAGAGAPVAAPTADDALQSNAPRMSAPLPPIRQDATPAVASACSVDADCQVKNVGNCCGDFQACVHKDAVADPAAVRAECAESGRASNCAYRMVTSCGCVQGQCRGGNGLHAR